MSIMSMLVAGGGFTPLSLFSGGVQGVWYDPSDLSTMFEDSAGTTAVHTPGNGTADSPVGKILDKSGNGNHATQSTSTKRPTLSAKYNLLTYTEDFSNAAWSKIAQVNGITPVVTANAGTDPLGGNTATRVVFSRTTATSADRSYLQQTATGTGSTNYTLSCWVKSATGTDQQLSIYGNFGVGGARVWITATSTWQLFTCSETSSAGGTSLPLAIGFFADTTSGLTSDVLIWGAQIKATNDGVGLPAYQRVVDANTYDSVGFPYYLKSDGVDDALVTGNIDFSAVNLVDYFPAVRKLTTDYQCVFEFSSGFANSSFTFFSQGQQVDDWYVGIKGAIGLTGYSSYTTNTSPPRSAIIAASLVIGPTAPVARINSASATPTTSNANSGTGNLGTWPLYLMARSGTTYFFNGRIYGLIIRGAASTAAQISNTETWLNQKAKIY